MDIDQVLTIQYTIQFHLGLNLIAGENYPDTMLILMLDVKCGTGVYQMDECLVSYVPMALYSVNQHVFVTGGSRFEFNSSL